jgi:RNA-directed DNA polymerase
VIDLPPHLYFQYGLEQGQPLEVVSRASTLRTALTARGLLPILTLGHLAHLTGASYTYLREITQRTRDPYVEIVRHKPDGGIRTLSSPEPPLMEVQRWILRNVLIHTQIHSSSFAYQTNRSIAKCASIHLGARWLVKTDLHDFFNNIDEVRVYKIFHQLGYSPLVSLELTRICTRLPLFDIEHRTRAHSYPSIPFYATDLQGWLPQGAPTSGALANAAAFTLDKKLSLVATRRSMIYTRYSDDLTFSTTTNFNRAQATGLIDHVGNVVRDERFSVHRKKTRIVPPGARHIVLGLMLGPDRLRLLPDFKRRIEVHIRGVDIFGLTQHSAHRGFRSIFSFTNHVDGCLAFAQGIEPVYAQEARQRWSNALAKSGFPIDEP